MATPTPASPARRARAAFIRREAAYVAHMVDPSPEKVQAFDAADARWRRLAQEAIAQEAAE